MQRAILVVDSDAGFVERVRSLLPERPVIAARSIHEAAQLVPTEPLGLAVLGPSYGSEEGLASADAIRTASPGTPVALVANIVTNRMLRAAMRFGLADVVGTPLTEAKANELLAAERNSQASATQSPGVAEPPPATFDFEVGSTRSAEAFVEVGAPPVALATPPPITPAPSEAPPQPRPASPWTGATTPEDRFFAPNAQWDHAVRGPNPAAPSVDPAPPAVPLDAKPDYEAEADASTPSRTPPNPPSVEPAANPDPEQPLPPVEFAANDAEPRPAWETEAGAESPVAGPIAPPAPGEHLVMHPGDQDSESPEGHAASLGFSDAPEPSGLARPSGSGRVVAVMAGKGGSGKTVTATNLALALTLQRGEDRVALVDADLQFGDVALLLQMDPARTIVDVSRRFEEVADDKLASMLLRHDSGLRVVPAPVLPTTRDEVPAKTVARIVNRLRSLYEVVVVDTPPILDDDLVTILDEVDDVLVVVDMDLPSVKNAKIALDALEGSGFPMGRLRLVVNRVNANAPLDLVELEGSLGLRVACSIPSDRLVSQSVSEGIPVVALSPRSRVAGAFHALADLIQNDSQN